MLIAVVVVVALLVVGCGAVFIGINAAGDRARDNFSSVARSIQGYGS